MQIKTIIKTIIQAIKDEIEILRWQSEKHIKNNSKCIEFGIKLCPYCFTKRYNTCLIECNRKNILLWKKIGDSPEENIRMRLKPGFYGDYSLYMIYAVKQYFAEYEYLIYKEYEDIKQ